MTRRLGPTQKKILLLLSAGVGLGFSRSLGDHIRIINGVSKEWDKINRSSLRYSIKSLYDSKLVKWIEKPGGSVELTLTDKGKNKVLIFNPDTFQITKPKKWDGKWRIIIFDIPEKRRGARDSLRSHLRQLGFHELQKSVFVHPYPCDDIFDFLVEFHDARKHVRFIVADSIDNSLHIKDVFGLIG